MDDAAAETRWVTYDELAKARHVSKASATRLAFRRKWPRQRGNDGTARVAVPVAELETPKPASRDAIHDDIHDDRDDKSGIIKALTAHVATLQEQIAQRDVMLAQKDAAIAKAEAGADQARRAGELDRAAAAAERAAAAEERGRLLMQLERLTGELAELREAPASPAPLSPRGMPMAEAGAAAWHRLRQALAAAKLRYSKGPR